MCPAGFIPVEPTEGPCPWGCPAREGIPERHGDAGGTLCFLVLLGVGGSRPGVSGACCVVSQPNSWSMCRGHTCPPRTCSGCRESARGAHALRPFLCDRPLRDKNKGVPFAVLFACRFRGECCVHARTGVGYGRLVPRINQRLVLAFAHGAAALRVVTVRSRLPKPCTQRTSAYPSAARKTRTRRPSLFRLKGPSKIARRVKEKQWSRKGSGWGVECARAQKRSWGRRGDEKGVTKKKKKKLLLRLQGLRCRAARAGIISAASILEPTLATHRKHERNERPP